MEQQAVAIAQLRRRNRWLGIGLIASSLLAVLGNSKLIHPANAQFEGPIPAPVIKHGPGDTPSAPSLDMSEASDGYQQSGRPTTPELTTPGLTIPGLATPRLTTRGQMMQGMSHADLDFRSSNAANRSPWDDTNRAVWNERRARLYRQRMEQLRDRLLNSPQPDANTAIAVNLYDMNRALSSLPLMAQQLEAMNQKLEAVPDIAEQMADLSDNMGVISSGVDSTMGRMGRFGNYGMGWPPY